MPQPDSYAVPFTHDVLGRRVRKRFRGKVTKWVWDGDKPLHEWSELEVGPGASNVEDLTTWLFEEASFAPTAKLTAQGAQSVVSDHLGTPLALYDGQGKVTWEMSLDAYGAVRQGKGKAQDCPFRYQGQYEDVETGLYYNRFRYYDPEMGQYICQDPTGLGGGLSSIYSYVYNPAVWTDPLGLAPCPSLDKINIDTGSAFAFVSEGSPVRHLLKSTVGGKQMVMTQTAHAEFGSVIATIAGPQEQARAGRFLSRVQVVTDDASARASALTVTKKVGANDKIIFGTADKLGIKTVTADAKFLRGAEAQGVVFDAITHSPVPLTGK